VRMVLINQNLFSDSRRTLVLKLKNCSDNWSLFGAISDTRTILGTNEMDCIGVNFPWIAFCCTHQPT